MTSTAPFRAEYEKASMPVRTAPFMAERPPKRMLKPIMINGTDEESFRKPARKRLFTAIRAKSRSETATILGKIKERR